MSIGSLELIMIVLNILVVLVLGPGLVIAAIVVIYRKLQRIEGKLDEIREKEGPLTPE